MAIIYTSRYGIFKALALNQTAMIYNVSKWKSFGNIKQKLLNLAKSWCITNLCQRVFQSLHPVKLSKCAKTWLDIIFTETASVIEYLKYIPQCRM